ncbi:hypothetical protein FOXG_18191 [Fusarium oxysporum f. sp. lycopersici 4287]|uniref:Uncharacterized protein n=2 Tax=Fusarium oxysporum TaxID=5507 RepID=A0A0J9UFB5_FUSO4|nr:hypothetical protein FOXG_18191 [Fusarium oxysporum f. sp. lycopersici 4287]EXK42236.1 hypothetical protein FOMG_05272 [Fusarium oxysporum f. sp. melonis 26406]KNA96780.1 hypothetical protein FOXG_18191 [Fusarium oxysporum f. sp. lycopersici 4287]
MDYVRAVEQRQVRFSQRSWHRCSAGSGSKRRVVPVEVEIGVMLVGMNLQIRNVS